MSFEYINQAYSVDACVGRRVVVDGEAGVIVGVRNAHLKVNFDKDKPSYYSYCHPTWHVEYQGMGEVRKMTVGQKRYQEYLDADCCETFAEWLGVDKASKERREWAKKNGVCA